METYIGYIKTPQDALIVFEACRRGQLHRVQRRLSTKERIHIQSGSVFAWDEREAGMRRWTDGRTWSPSRVLGSFLTYRELDTKRRPRRSSSSSTSSAHHHQHHHHAPVSKAASACSYKADGLIKQSFSICTAANQKLHLISYYTKADVLAGRLKQPSADSMLSQIVVPKGLYPELNPLDTSGGHSATIHNMRQSYMSNATGAVASTTSSPPSPPPSLSSSPVSSDEDMMLVDAPAITTTPTQQYQHRYHLRHQQQEEQPQQPQQQCDAAVYERYASPSATGGAGGDGAPPSSLYTTTLPPPSSTSLQPSSRLAIQEIALDRIPCSEDQRQLRALPIEL
ncbi:camp independent regulatory protein [Lichtheimia corymbifera JMRC:FSU:9682]|uniref:Camp independent regulatory protein n=1 Tax=Lichtheimia corymbifera JMRC:FSU:9682 TaxID=1263082 RepID=A0A068RH33_9FUNG|nr:camp independent regulatory protein [Lichtheimia corymbifera JMRC:FSU:9682]